MTEADKCPTCKGWCCANHNAKFGPSIHYQHSGTKVHFCPDCEEGLAWTAYTEPAPKLPPRTAEEERADVVAYLRQRMEMAQLQVLGQTSNWADAIERGEHVGWSKDDTSRKAILDREHYRP